METRRGLAIVKDHSVRDAIAAQANFQLAPVCRQLYDELQGHLFRSNVFCFNTFWEAEELEYDYPEIARQVRYLAFRYQCAYDNKNKLFQALATHGNGRVEAFGEWKKVDTIFKFNLKFVLWGYTQLQCVHFFNIDPRVEENLRLCIRRYDFEHTVTLACRKSATSRLCYPAVDPDADPDAVWAEVDRLEVNWTEVGRPEMQEDTLLVHVWKRSPQLIFSSFELSCGDHRGLWQTRLQNVKLQMPYDVELFESFEDRVETGDW